jgi:molybdate transport system substrate-binding protein
MRFLKLLIGPALLAGVLGGARAAEVTVLTAGAFKQVVMAAAPAYKEATGNTLRVDNDTAGALARRVAGGEAFDLLILPAPVLAELAAKGLLAGAATPLASVGVGVAVRAGVPKPDISTVAAFRQALLNAPKIAYIDPAAGGSSGIYVAGLLTRLGVADTLRSRSVLVQGGLVADRVADGSADLAIHQISELLPVKGVELVGPLPEEIQSYTTYAGAVGGAARQPAAARDFLNLLGGPAGLAILREKGMQAPR